MPLTTQGYFNALKSYLDVEQYLVSQLDDTITLKEKIHVQGHSKKKEIKVRLKFMGDAFVIKLDAVNKQGNSDPLFHFLDDNGRPWSKRCDFVAFQHYNRNIRVYCIEFKYETLDAESIINQLKASVAWCQTLNHIAKNYTHQSKCLKLTKYVFSRHPDPADYLDGNGKYLRRDHTIRHYQYADVDGMHLEALENENVEEIR